MGLFDFGNQNPGLLGGGSDPKQAALMQAAFQLLAGSQKRGFLENIGTAGLSGLEGYGQAQQQQRQQKMQDFQFEQAQTEAQRRQAEWERQQRLQGLAGKFMKPPIPPTDANDPNAQPVEQSLDRTAYTRALEFIDPMMALQYEAATKKAAPALMNVAPGGSVFDPSKGAAVYNAPFKPPEPEKAPEALRTLEMIYGKGSPQYMRAAQQLARKMTTHQPATNISVNTTKPLLNEMAGGLGKQLDTSLETAKGAQSAIQNAQRMQQLLDSGKVVVGPGANAQTFVRQLGESLGVGGKDNAEVLANTQGLLQGMAQSELDAAAAMKGQGQITESERSILRRVAAGDQTLTAPELKQAARGIERNARARIQQHQSNVQRLQQIPEAAQLIPFYQVDMPTSPPKAPPTSAGGAGKLSAAEQQELEALRKRFKAGQ